MTQQVPDLSHVAGTLLIQADGAFLNGAGLDRRREDQNTTIPKTYRDGEGGRVPYVSAQAWRRWLRDTLIEETGWPKSELRAIGLSEKGTTDKIAGELNPVEFAEDDIFGYMRAAKGQGRESAADSGDDDAVKTDEEIERDRQLKFFKDMKAELEVVRTGKKKQGKGRQARPEDVSEDDRRKRADDLLNRLRDEARTRVEEDEEWKEKAERTAALATKAKSGGGMDLGALAAEMAPLVEEFNPGRLKAVMRASPLATSLLVSVRRKGWEGLDKGFVHLQEGTPLPYNTEFYNTHLYGVFCLDHARLGVFSNLGDRIELDEDKVDRFLKTGDIVEREDHGKLGKVYALKEAPAKRKRAVALLKALAVLRGGAKQAQFGTDTAPKVLILAGLTCGNPIFNNLFKEGSNGAPAVKIDTLKEVIADFADRIVTSVYLGVRSGYLENEDAVKTLSGWWKVDSLRKLDSSPDEEAPKGDEEWEERDGQQHRRWVHIEVGTPLDAAQKMAIALP